MKGPWIFGRGADLGVFLAPTLVAFAVLLAARLGGVVAGPLPDWAWLAFVLGIDVAHVWATLFRTYLDPRELRARPLLYLLLPLTCWGVGVALHARSSLLFWRVLAYLAVFHFIRQQVGWAAIYRARAGATSMLDRRIDEAALYLATLVPLLVWHTSSPRAFHWFVDGDFVALPHLAPLVVPAEAALVVALLAFVARQVVLARRGAPVPFGKLVVVATTAVSWWVGIVTLDDDLSFTLLNVLPHGVPYMALLFSYARARSVTAPSIPASRIVALGLVPFLLVLLGLAFGEELLWDRLVYRDRDWLFGLFPVAAPDAWRSFLVPLLSVPQATHYALDAFLWRRRDSGPELGVALGFRRASPSA